MNGRRRLAGAGPEGNQVGRSNLMEALASPRLRVPAPGKPIRQNQSGNIMFSGRVTHSLCPHCQKLSG